MGQGPCNDGGMAQMREPPAATPLRASAVSAKHPRFQRHTSTLRFAAFLPLRNILANWVRPRRWFAMPRSQASRVRALRASVNESTF